jgi:hypothetical protein
LRSIQESFWGVVPGSAAWKSWCPCPANIDSQRQTPLLRQVDDQAAERPRVVVIRRELQALLLLLEFGDERV